MSEEQLINKSKQLKKELKELDTKIATKELKLQRAQRRGQNKRELEGELKKELDDHNRQKDEIQKEISYLQKLVHLQGKSETKERKVQELQNQIKDLEKRNEIIGEFDKEIKELKRKKGELEGKILQLKSDIQDLNKKIEKKDKHVLLLENEMKENELNHQNRIKNITAKHDSEIKDLRFQTTAMIKKKADSHSKKMEELFDSNNFLENEVRELKTENSKMKTNLIMLKKVETGTCEKENQHILYIGQVCTELETNWYRHVMPKRCIVDRRAYKVKNIEEDLTDPEMLSEEEKTEAKRRWEQLQKKVNWKENKRLLVEAIMRLLYKRNQAAHPTITEEGARKATEELEKQGELTVKPSPKDVLKLIDLWVSSKSL